MRTLRDGVEHLSQNKDRIIEQFLNARQAEALDTFPNIRWRFVTLTFPSLLGWPLETGLKIANAAWNNFGKKSIWIKTAIGGCKAIEWTLGESHKGQGKQWSLETDGYHVHIYVLVYCLFVDATPLREAWTDAVLKACKKLGIDLTIVTPTGHCWINIKDVHPNNKACEEKGITTLDGAMGEVCKYVTKPQTWLELPDKEILTALEGKRRPRLFSTFGAMYGIGSKESANSPDGRIFNRQSLSSEALAGGAAIVAKTGRSKGERSPSLRQLARTMPFEKWDNLAESYFERGQQYRKFDILMRNPDVVLEMLDGELLTAEGLESPEGIGQKTTQ